jgi:hypothetical protein
MTVLRDSQTVVTFDSVVGLESRVQTRWSVGWVGTPKLHLTIPHFVACMLVTV